MDSRYRTEHENVVPREVFHWHPNPKIRLYFNIPVFNKKCSAFTLVWDDLQLFGPYFESLLSGSANRYSPSKNNEKILHTR